MSLPKGMSVVGRSVCACPESKSVLQPLVKVRPGASGGCGCQRVDGMYGLRRQYPEMSWNTNKASALILVNHQQ